MGSDIRPLRGRKGYRQWIRNNMSVDSTVEERQVRAK
jgi:hypothetical protein